LCKNHFEQYNVGMEVKWSIWKKPFKV
jgi:hypothetical protein